MFSKENIKPLTIAVVIAVAYGAFFLRPYFSLIVLAVILAFLFAPVFNRFKRKRSEGFAAALTLLTCVGVILVPFVIILFFTSLQIQHILHNLDTSTINTADISDTFLNRINKFLALLPGDLHISQAQYAEWLQKVATGFANWALNLITGIAGGISGFVTSTILFMYVFSNLLIHEKTLIKIIRDINPLGESASDTYLGKMGAMTKGMVKGQFIIAFFQGLTDALLLFIVGYHQIFLFMFVLLTFLSIIPLGGGIIVIPFGIILILTGNIWQGLVVLLGHFLIVTNIDNFLRPKLVPQKASLNSALTILSVFAGIAMFGFLGIVIGPVLMILIVTTVQMYLEVRNHKALPKKGKAV